MLKKLFLKYFGLKANDQQNVRVAGNMWALFLLQLANYILPLVIIPVLIIRLGDDNYGMLAFGLYTIQYLIILADYGFFFSATRQVSLLQDENKQVSEIFWSVQYSRFILSMLGFGLLIVFMATVQITEDQKGVMMLLFLMVIGNVFSAQWMFQGMERMGWITIVQMVSKVCLLLGVLIWVKTPEDIRLAAFLHGLTQLVAGILSFIVALRLFHIKWIIPQATSVIQQLRSGWHVFITTFYTTLYTNTNGFLLYFLTGRNEALVGYYQAGEKIVRAVASLFNPFMTALFPYISRKIEENRGEGIKLFFKLFNRVSVLTFFCMILVWVFAPFIGDWLVGENADQVIPIIQILAVIVFFGTAGAMLSLQLYLNIGWKNRLPYFLFLLALLDVALCFWLIPHSQHNGAALALAITEVAAPALYLMYYRSYGPRFYNN